MAKRKTGSTAPIAKSRRWYELARTAVKKGTYRKMLCKFTDYVANLPLVLAKTPDEWADEELHLAEDEGRVRYVPSPVHPHVRQRQIVMLPPKPGSIRVKVYRRMDQICQDSTLCWDVDLDNGCLNLHEVHKRYDLQNLIIVDSTHVVPFKPQQHDILSPLAVHVLMDNQHCLRVIECPTAGRRFARNLRLYMIGRREALVSWTQSKVKMSVDCILVSTGIMVALLAAVFFVFCWLHAHPVVRRFVTSPVGFLMTCFVSANILAWAFSFLPD